MTEKKIFFRVLNDDKTKGLIGVSFGTLGKTVLLSVQYLQHRCSTSLRMLLCNNEAI